MSSMELVLMIASIAIGAALIFYFGYWRRRETWTVFTGKLPTKYSAVTPNGHQVYSAQPITTAKLKLIDTGIAKGHRIAREAGGYSGFSTIYTVWLFPISDKCEAKSILQRFNSSNPYDGTEFDKDPQEGRVALCFAGRMNRVSLERGGMILADDDSVLENGAWFETEHNVLFEVDVPRYLSTQYHGEGSGHPIIPEGGEENIRGE